MRSVLVLAMWLAVLIAPPLSAQEGQPDKPLAGLVSQETAFYAEVRRPDVLAAKLPELLRGTVLENYPFGLEKLREKGIEPGPWAELLGLLLTPEGQQEARKMRGLAVAVRSPNAMGGWDYVVLLQPGDSTVVNLFLRRHLASEQAQLAEEVEGVPVYRCLALSETFAARRKGNLPGNVLRMQMEMQRRMMQQMQRMIQQRGIAPALVNPQAQYVDYALLPGLIVFGSPELVKEAVALAKGRAALAVLADNKGFQEAANNHGPEAGVLLFGDLNVLEAQLSRVDPGLQPAWSGWLRHFVKPSSLKAITGSLTLDKDEPRLRLKIGQQGDQPSPLIACVPEAKVNPALLHYVPTRLEGAMLMANPEGERLWKVLLEVCDAWARTTQPGGQPPSRRVAQYEEHLKIQFGKEVAGRIKHLVLAQGADTFDGSLPRLLAVVEAADDEAAKGLVEPVLAKILEAVSGEQIVPTVKEVKGRTVMVAEVPNLGTLCTCRQGAVVVVGNDQDVVLDALAAGERKQGLLGEARVAKAVAEAEGAGIVFLMRPPLLSRLANGEGFLARALTAWGSPQAHLPGPQFGPVANQIQFQVQIGGGQAGVVLPQPPVPGPPAVAAGDREEGFALAPVLISVSREGRDLLVEARLTEILPTVPRFVDLLLEQEAGTNPFGMVPQFGPAVPGQPIRPNIRNAVPAVPAVPQLPVPVPIQPPELPKPPANDKDQ